MGQRDPKVAKVLEAISTQFTPKLKQRLERSNSPDFVVSTMDTQKHISLSTVNTEENYNSLLTRYNSLLQKMKRAVHEIKEEK